MKIRNIILFFAGIWVLVYFLTNPVVYCMEPDKIGDLVLKSASTNLVEVSRNSIALDMSHHFDTLKVHSRGGLVNYYNTTVAAQVHLAMQEFIDGCYPSSFVGKEPFSIDSYHGVHKRVLANLLHYKSPSGVFDITSIDDGICETEPRNIIKGTIKLELGGMRFGYVWNNR